MKAYLIGATMFILLFTNQTYADDCGKKDRVPLPSCVDHAIAADQKSYIFQNNCSHPVTIKVDIKHDSDDLVTVTPGVHAIGATQGGSQIGVNALSKPSYVDAAKQIIKFFKGKATIRALKCCPKYNSCSNS